MAGFESSARSSGRARSPTEAARCGASTGAIDLPVTWGSRVEAPEGRTSPEELVAAAHAACYAMAFSHVLGEAGSPPERLRRDRARSRRTWATTGCA